jgi:hypothetical protein
MVEEDTRFRPEEVTPVGSFELLHLDVYRLMQLFLSSRAIAEAADRSAHNAAGFLSEAFERAEAARLLIGIAVRLRAILDFNPHATWELKHAPQSVGALQTASDSSGRRSKVPLTFREACNKIIHAHHINFDRRPTRSRKHRYLAPVVYLYGSHRGRDWKANLRIREFAECAFRAS